MNSLILHLPFDSTQVRSFVDSCNFDGIYFVEFGVLLIFALSQTCVFVITFVFINL